MHDPGLQSTWREIRRNIRAEGGGSTGSRVRWWKWEMQQLVDEMGLSITVCHLPPGTRKWNKIEHSLFAWISQNWRGQPLVSYAVILKLIAATTTEAGLTVQCQLDTNLYPAGRKISDEDMATSPYNRTHSTTNGTIPFRLGPLQLIMLLLDGSLGLLDVPPAIYDRLGTQSPKPPENDRTMSDLIKVKDKLKDASIANTQTNTILAQIKTAVEAVKAGQDDLRENIKVVIQDLKAEVVK